MAWTLPNGMNAVSPAVSTLRSSPTHCSIDSGAQEEHFLLVGVAVEVVALSGSDLHVEHAQPLPLGHVGGADDPTEISPVEFLPLDVFDADETHHSVSFLVRSLDIRKVISLNASV